MQCIYCHANIPDGNDICPNCRRLQLQTNTTNTNPPKPQFEVDDNNGISNEIWRTSGLAFWKVCLYAIMIAIVAGLFASFLFSSSNLNGDTYDEFGNIIPSEPIPIDVNPETADTKGSGDMVGGIVFAIPILFWLYQTIKLFHLHIFQKYELRTNEIRKIQGVFSRTQSSILLKNILGIHLSQNIIQRIFGLGNITIYSVGTNSSKVIIHDIDVVDRKFEKLLNYYSLAIYKSNTISADSPSKKPWSICISGCFKKDKYVFYPCVDCEKAQNLSQLFLGFGTITCSFK